MARASRARWRASAAYGLNPAVASARWHRRLGGRCPSLAGYVAATGTRRGAPAAGGCLVLAILILRVRLQDPRRRAPGTYAPEPPTDATPPPGVMASPLNQRARRDSSAAQPSFHEIVTDSLVPPGGFPAPWASSRRPPDRPRSSLPAFMVAFCPCCFRQSLRKIPLR